MSEPITIAWQPCEDELPEPHRAVLVHLSDTDELVWIGYHDGGFWRGVDDIKFAGEITHWADLPEPPPEEAE
jgi:hypothetical protein